MRKIFLIAILCLVPFIGQAQELQAPFAHPGLNHSRADLERMKEKVLAKEKPWIDGWDALCAFRDAQSDFKASPKPSLGGTDGTRQRASRDAMAAYYNILRWYVTGDEAHARCAVDILNAWSASVQSVVTGELYMLPACEFMEAAELVRLYPGWKAEDVERFEKMARDYIYPACRDFRGEAGTWPGWDGPANVACLYIGIFLDDAEMVNDAIAYYKTGKGGGCITEGIVFGGQPVEMGRDQPHAAIGIDAYADLCQALWNQGLDMYAYEDNLLLKGFEYYARFNLEHPVDWTPIDYHGHKFYYPAPSNNAPSSMPNNRILANEAVYHHYVDRKGLDAPYLRAMMKLKNVEVLTGMMYTYSDTTTAYVSFPVPPIPEDVKVTGSIGRIDLDWASAEGDVANGYDVQRSVSSDNGFETVGSWSGNATTEFADRDVEPGTTYYYRVRAKNRSGESVWSEPVSGTAQPGSSNSLLSGWAQQDIGKEEWMIDGVTKYSPVNGHTFVLTGSGRDIYSAEQPEGNFTYTAVTGDFELVARIYDGEQEGSQLKEKFGLAVRENTTTSSPKVMLWVGDAGTRYTHFMWRNTVDGNGDVAGSDHTWVPVWLKLVRKGNVFEAYVSDSGTRWYAVGASEISFPDDCLVGMWVCGGAYRPEGYTVGFDHVALTCGGGTKPSVPTDLEAKVLGSTSLSLSWKASGHVSSFKLCRSTSPNGPFETVAGSLSAPSYTDEGLEPGTTYYYKVWAANAVGESEEAATVSAATEDLSLPGRPEAAEAKAGNGYVSLTWDATGERTAYYQVRRGSMFGGPYTLIGRAMENRYTDHKVDNGKMYYYVVSAVNAVGEGAYSEEAKAYPQVGSCRYWPFDEEGGTAASDVWNGGEAQLVNNSRFDTGKYGTGIHLSGGHITLPAGVTETWKDFTLSLWVKPDRVEDWARIMDCGTGTDNNLFLTVKAAQTGCLRYAIVQGTSGEQQINTDFCPKASEWTHIVLVQQGTTGILYANGAEVGRNENLTLSPADLGYTTRNYIGRSAHTVDPYLQGIVDDLRIYDCALEADQVSALYQASAQQITCSGLPSMKVGDEELTPSATATSGLSLTFRSSRPEVAEVVDGCRIRALSPGEAEITALQTGNLLYAAAVPVSQTLVVEDGDGVESTSSDGIEIKVLLKEGFLHLSFSQPMGDGCRIRLFNMNGVLVRSDILSGDNLCKWDMHGLSSGVYLIKVESEVYFTTLKIIL